MTLGFDGTADCYGRDEVVTATLRAVRQRELRPTNLLPALVVVAPVNWTGTGSDEWQARTCNDQGHVSHACFEVRPAKDLSLIVSHTAELASWAR